MPLPRPCKRCGNRIAEPKKYQTLCRSCWEEARIERIRKVTKSNRKRFKINVNTIDGMTDEEGLQFFGVHLWRRMRKKLRDNKCIERDTGRIVNLRQNLVEAYWYARSKDEKGRKYCDCGEVLNEQGECEECQK